MLIFFFFCCCIICASFDWELPMEDVACLLLFLSFPCWHQVLLPTLTCLTSSWQKCLINMWTKQEMFWKWFWLYQILLLPFCHWSLSYKIPKVTYFNWFISIRNQCSHVHCMYTCKLIHNHVLFWRTGPLVRWSPL